MSDFRFPWESEDAPVGAATPLPRGAAPSKPRGRRPRASVDTATTGADAATPGTHMATPGVHTATPGVHTATPAGQDRPGWLYHRLVVTGPAETIAAFAAAARGSGITPWATDPFAVEDDVFTLAAAQPPALRRLSIEGCRTLARQFRDRFEAHHARAAERVGHSRACPLDLHALLPVPDALLRRGNADPAASAWRATNWGTEALRHVTLLEGVGPGRRLKRGEVVIGYGFFTGGDTPQAAATHLAAHWAGLRFVLQPRPD